jgi:hypothetical protein
LNPTYGKANATSSSSSHPVNPDNPVFSFGTGSGAQRKRSKLQSNTEAEVKPKRSEGGVTRLDRRAISLEGQRLYFGLFFKRFSLTDKCGQYWQSSNWTISCHRVHLV